MNDSIKYESITKPKQLPTPSEIKVEDEVSVIHSLLHSLEKEHPNQGIKEKLIDKSFTTTKSDNTHEKTQNQEGKELEENTTIPWTIKKTSSTKKNTSLQSKTKTSNIKQKINQLHVPKKDSTIVGNNDTQKSIKARNIENKFKIGRWTRPEQALFIEGLHIFPKGGNNRWRKIAEYVGTRTILQTRTHAQKYFAKIANRNETEKIKHMKYPFTNKVETMRQKNGTRQNSSSLSCVMDRMEVEVDDSLDWLLSNMNKESVLKSYIQQASTLSITSDSSKSFFNQGLPPRHPNKVEPIHIPNDYRSLHMPVLYPSHMNDQSSIPCKRSGARPTRSSSVSNVDQIKPISPEHYLPIDPLNIFTNLDECMFNIEELCGLRNPSYNQNGMQKKQSSVFFYGGNHPRSFSF